MSLSKFLEILKYLKNVIEDSIFKNKVYAVGGCCRDYVMNIPIKDIDLCVELPNGGIKLAEYLQSKNAISGNIITYPTYGTAMFRLLKFPEEEIECVMTRGEQYHDKNSRNPITTYASLKEDCFRRDLTINAIYYNVSTCKFLDPTNLGIKSIENKIIKVTNENPDIVFKDDPLRILRCIRFATRYNWNIESNTYKSLIKNINGLSIISQERITNEFNEIISSRNPILGMKLLKDSGAMKYVLPEICETYDITQNKYHVGTVYEHTLLVLKNCSNYDAGDIILRIACLLHDIGKIKCKTVVDGKIHFFNHETIGAEFSEKILKRMKYSNDFIKEVVFLIKNHMLTKQWGDGENKVIPYNKVRKLQYLCKTKERFYRLMQLIHADNSAHKKEYCMYKQIPLIVEKSEELYRSHSDMFGYKLPINGFDIMKAKNLQSSPVIKKYLNGLLNNAFSNPFINKENCLKIIKHWNFK